MRTLLSLMLAVSLGGATMVHGALPSTLQDRQYQMFTEVSGLPAVRATAVSGAIGVALSSSIMDRWFSAFEECSGNPCLRISVSGGIAPTDAQYWVGAANATLTAEKDLSGFTALVLNTAGTPSAYAGTDCGAGNAIRALNASGVGSTCVATSSGTTLDAITAAAADQAGIANADWNIRWNWQKTTNSEVAFEFGESAASTNGTSTGGVPNQVLLKLSTVAASTMSPLSVYSRAAHVFSVSPTTAQIFAANGSATAPLYSFAGDSGGGMYHDGSHLYLNVSGTATPILKISANLGFGNPGIRINASATATTPGLSNATGNTGLYWPATNTMGIGNSTDGEWVRWLTFAQQVNQAGANATSYAINFRKSRGTVASPTVITTGDNLATISGYGYVGGTNTYQEAANILFDSTGTISDSATGIAGIIRFYTAATGAEPAQVWAMDNTGNLISTGVVQASLGTPADGSIIYCSDCTIANPCAGAGTGALAKRLNGVWVCN